MKKLKKQTQQISFPKGFCSIDKKNYCKYVDWNFAEYEIESLKPSVDNSQSLDKNPEVKTNEVFFEF